MINKYLVGCVLNFAFDLIAPQDEIKAAVKRVSDAGPMGLVGLVKEAKDEDDLALLAACAFALGINITPETCDAYFVIKNEAYEILSGDKPTGAGWDVDSPAVREVARKVQGSSMGDTLGLIASCITNRNLVGLFHIICLLSCLTT